MTIYLDQNQLSNLVKPGNEELRQRFVAHLKREQTEVAISYPHLLETAAIGTRRVFGAVVREASPLVDAIADLVEAMPTIKMWSAFEIMRVEFLSAAEAHLSGQSPRLLAPFGNWDFIGSRVQAMTFRAEVSRVRLTPSILNQYWRTAEANAQWRDGVKAKESPPANAKFRDLLQAEASATADLFLRNPNYAGHWPQQMSLTDRQQFVKALVPSHCPALALYIALSSLDRASRTKSGAPRRSRPNDIVDLQAAAAATYCDDFITERGLADHIKQVRKHTGFLGTIKARVFTTPAEYLKACTAGGEPPACRTS